MAEPIVIWGAGAIGGTIGAYWARAGIDVLFVDVVADHIQTCAQSGLSIEGPVDQFSVKVPGVTPDALSGEFSRIVLAVKAHHTRTATEALRPHLKADGYVLSAQNGLNEKVIAEVIGAERTMGCFVNFGADWHAPGRILFGNRGATVVGEIDGTVCERTREMHRLLRIFEPDAVLTEDIWGFLWGKIAYGAMLTATALTVESMTENFAKAERFVAFQTLGREVMAVAAAEGVTPRSFNGFEANAFKPGAAESAARASVAAMADFNSRTAKTHSGIWRDLAVRKRKTEVNAQFDPVIAIARGHGIAVPALEQLSRLVGDIEAGRRPQSDETMKALIKTCTSALTNASSS
jgi:2-dehydropantoate 2-reductase